MELDTHWLAVGLGVTSGWLVQQRMVAALAWCGGGGSTGLGLVLGENNVTINRGIGHPLACSGAWCHQWRVGSTTCGGSTGLGLGLGLVGLVLDENNVTINRGIGHPLACSGAVGWLVGSATCSGSSTGLGLVWW